MACISYVIAGSALLQLVILVVNLTISAYPPLVVLLSLYMTSQDARTVLSDSDYVFSSSVNKLFFVLTKSLFVLLSLLIVCVAMKSK